MAVFSGLKTRVKSGFDSFKLKRLNGVSAGIILLVILAVVFILSFALGRYPISPIDVIKILTQNLLETISLHHFTIEQTWADILETVVIQIRLPRILAAMLIGGSLAIAGVSFQGLFRNPLVSPDILGVSSGASLGAALGILLSGNRVVIELLAFAIAIFAVATSYSISRIVKGNATLSLILAGMAMGSLLSAFLSLAKYAADTTNELPAITYWLMGSLASINLHDLAFACIPMLTGIIILLLIRWRFNVLAMGEEEAMALGINTGRIRLIIVLCCTVITASAVSISGTIGWIGLVMPHIGRMLVGPDHKKLIPVTLLLGAIFLLIIDNVARVVAQIEIPIGILTAIIGVPFFLYLLSRGRKGWA
jgi:iron complex transport system permease protein